MNDRFYLSTRAAIWACFISWALYSPLMPQRCQETWATASAGIGVMIAKEEGDIVVKQVVRSGPAAQVGVRAGDIISKVNGKDTSSMTMDQVVSLILGQAGTMVHLDIVRKGDLMREVVIGRAPLDGRSSQWSSQPVAKQPSLAKSPPNPNEILHLRSVPIMDWHGWGQPVPAKTLLIPANWHTKGGVNWKSTYCVNDLIAENFFASSPDGQLVYETLPGYSWQWGNDQISQTTIRMSGCVMAPPKGPEQVLQDIIVRYRRGAYIRNVERSPEAARAVYDELYHTYGYYYNAQGITLRTDAVRAMIEYQYGGINYEEWITFSWVEAATPGMVTPPVYSYFVKDIAAFRAPKGQLKNHETLFSAILASIRTNPAWHNAMLQLIANVSSNASRAAGNRAAIWSNAMNQIGEMRLRTWQKNNETLSRVSVSWSRAFRGVDAYVDPTTNQTVELPTGYRNAWSDGIGGYVLSPDPSFDPNVKKFLKQQNWHKMKLQR